ncbi:hypothetical protein D3C84_1137940 [compost metagenome]
MGIATQAQQQAFAQFRISDHAAFADKRTYFDDHLAPGFTAFPPALVAGVVAKAHEDRQRQTKQGKGRGIDPGKQGRVQVLDQHDQ